MNTIFNLALRIFCVLSMAFFVSCSSMPTYSGNGEGRFAIYSESTSVGITQGPWWNYQALYRNLSTDEEGVLTIFAEKEGRTFHVSEALTPGEYTIYELSVKTKQRYDNEVEREDVDYRFRIVEGTITYIGGVFRVLTERDWQYRVWEKADSNAMTERAEAWLVENGQEGVWDIRID